MNPDFDLNDVRLRPAQPSDHATLFAYACELEWYTCPSVLETWTNPKFSDGFCVAEYAGKPVGSILAYNFTEKDTFIGFYVVGTELRGRGIGKRLWDWMLDHAKGRNLWLATATHNISMYARRGLCLFRPATAIRKFTKVHLNIEPHHDRIVGKVLEYDGRLLDELVTYDASFSGFNRSKMLSIWLRKEPTLPIFVVKRDGRIVGYGGALKHSEGLYKIAPLYADDTKIARDILSRIVTSLPPDAKFIADFTVQDHVIELFEGVLPPGTLDNLGDSFLMTSEGAGLPMDTSKLYCYTQVDTVPI